DEGSPKPSPKRWVGPVNTYQPPRDPRKFVLEIAAKRYEVPAIAVWAIAIGTFLLDMSVFLEIGTFFADAGIDVDVFIFLLTGLLAVLVRPALALIPAVFAQRRGRPFLPWFLYGYIFFLVTLIFVLLLKPVEKPDFSQQDLRQVSFARQSLRQVNFQGANVAGVDFSQADLAAANFKQANCTGTRFNQASIRGTCFDQATLSQATFVRARQGTAAIAINRTFSSIPPLLWGLIIVFVAIPTLAGGLLFAIGPLFRILLLIGLGYTVMSLGITWVVIKLTHLNREAAPLIWGGGVGLAIVVRLSATPMTPTMPGLIVISLGLAAIAQVSLLINRWHLYGAAIGALSTLCFTEVWAVLFQLYVMPVGLRWVFAVLGALIGCLIGAGIQQGLPSFRAARLINTDFSYADLKLADFRETEMQQATFYRAQLPGAFRPTGRRQWLANLAICLSEQITAYLQRFRT
ncbi:MAG: pentapeptide repeat-containing protein, partial [Cyanobacteria bacterium P01_A01_bin.70]